MNIVIDVFLVVLAVLSIPMSILAMGKAFERDLKIGFSEMNASIMDRVAMAFMSFTLAVFAAWVFCA